MLRFMFLRCFLPYVWSGHCPVFNHISHKRQYFISSFGTLYHASKNSSTMSLGRRARSLARRRGFQAEKRTSSPQLHESDSVPASTMSLIAETLSLLKIVTIRNRAFLSTGGELSAVGRLRSAAAGGHAATASRGEASEMVGAPGPAAAAG